MNVKVCCRIFGLSRQGYYKALSKEEKSQKENHFILNKVKTLRLQQPRVGTRKLYRMLLEDFKQNQIKIGRDALFNLLREERMLVKKRKNHTRTTQSYHRFRKHPNLLKDKILTEPQQAWVSDITYLRTQKGFLYLSLITDAYSRKIVGYYLSDNLKAESSLKALKMALKGKANTNMELIHHSDRGFQYCSPSYTLLLEKNHIKISMTTKYDPYENAIAERVNGILKNEFYLDQTFVNEAQAKRVVKQTIEIYNQKRLHLSLKYKTPNQVHQNLMESPADGNQKISKKGISLSLKKNNYLYKN